MNRPDPTGFAEVERQRWMQQVALRLGNGCGDEEFDARFIRFLLAQLDARGYQHLSHAVLRSGLDVAAQRSGREEFDALVDLAIRLVAQGRWDIPAALPARRSAGGPDEKRGPSKPGRNTGLAVV